MGRTVTYVPEIVKDIPACPSCGAPSTSMVSVLAGSHDVCIQCGKAWERLPKGEPYLMDGEMMPWREPCDNCAFRGNSPERADPAAWKELQDKLAAGHMFYCHKGVPFAVAKIAEGGETPFEFPRTADGKDFDREKMRTCRGYLNAHILPAMKKHAG